MYIKNIIGMLYFYAAETYTVISGTFPDLFAAAGESHLHAELLYCSLAAFKHFKGSVVPAECINYYSCQSYQAPSAAILRRGLRIRRTFPFCP